MKKKLVIGLEIVLIILEILYLGISKKEYLGKIENVSYNEDANLNNTVAYMLYDEKTNDYKEDTNRTEWPNKANYVYVKAKCYDGEGTELRTVDVLSFSQDTFSGTISTGTSLYCYLYFAKTDTPLGAAIKNSASGTFETDDDLNDRNKALKAAGVADADLDTLRRFKGYYGQVNNFICFGIANQDECLANTDKYMYRIIGIDANNNQVKLIKATYLMKGSKTTFAVHNTTNGDIKWEDTDMYKYLNATTVNTVTDQNYFMGNRYYNYLQNATWKNLIVEHPTWYVGDSEYIRSETKESIYANERKRKITNGNPISLMYLSDYFYSYNPNDSNWLFVYNGLDRKVNTGAPIDGGTLRQPPKNPEWIMTRNYKYVGVVTQSFMRSINSDGEPYSGGESLTRTYSIRPVFYLKSGVKIGGKGTFTEPYIISLP